MSLLKCLWTAALGSGVGVHGRYHYAEGFPHYVVFGGHLREHEEKVYGIEFEIDQAEYLFRDWAAFGTIREIDDDLQRAFKKHKRLVRKDGIVAYFSGRRDLFSAKVAFGSVKVNNSAFSSAWGTTGGKFESRVVITLRFNRQTTLNSAVSEMMDIRRLFALLIGRPQNLTNVMLLSGSKKKIDRYRLLMTAVNTFPEALEGRRRGIEPLIQAVSSPNEMRQIVRGWTRDRRRLQSARRRFFDSFENKHYSPDRLIAAANLFDLIPDDINPVPEIHNESLAEVLAETKRKLRALPRSAERDGALNTLGRITAPNLKRKIAAWCDELFSKKSFRTLQFVTDQAIDARNHYVHGSAAKFNYEANSGMFISLVKSLEFAFGVSYLMKLGWDFEKWQNDASSGDHDFKAFIFALEDGLVSKLKRIIAEDKEK